MKILYTPLMIVPSLSAEQRAGILEAAGPGTVLVEAKEPARQRAEIVDTDILFGRVAPDIFVLNRRLRFYHSIGAGVDAVLSPELVQSDILALVTGESIEAVIESLELVVSGPVQTGDEAAAFDKPAAKT